LPPLPVQQPIYSLPVPDTTALADPPPLPAQQPISVAQQPISSLPVPDTTAPASSLSSLPPSSPAGQPTPAPTTSSVTSPLSLNPAAETPLANSSGYVLIFKWCPNCKINLIDSRDFECHACQDRRNYYSLEYEEE
jgi:cell division septation protein DedD